MTDRQSVSRHYGQSGLLDAILNGIDALGKTTETVTVEDLAPVDEFHVGGREATRSLLDQMQLGRRDDVLDIGCGIGGAARFAAATYGCRVTGIDVTEEYVVLGMTMSAWVGCDAGVDLKVADATDSGYAEKSFDSAFMLHVGMNIPAKHALASEVYRLLKPGGRFGIYDLMHVGDGELQFPLPWAAAPETSALERPSIYREALEGAGFEIEKERDRRAFALEFATRMKAKLQNRNGLPPLGLHLLMGPKAPEKYGNMVAGIAAGIIAPVEMLARKPER